MNRSAFHHTRLLLGAALLVALAMSLPVGAPRAAAQATIPLCADFDGTTSNVVRADVPYNALTAGSVFCRVIAENGDFVRNAAEVGDAAVLDQGVIQAVDVFGILHTGVAQPDFNARVKVCLLGSGTLWYLDATVSPRYVSRLGATREGGYTCGRIDNAGTVVLTVRDGGVTATTSGAVTGGGADEDEGDDGGGASQPATGCTVTTRAILNLRAEPSMEAEVLLLVPYDIRLIVYAHQGSWVQVNYRGTPGWLHTQFVNASLNCDF